MRTAIILAAGGSNRYGTLKQFELVAGKAVFLHVLDAYLSQAFIEHIVLVCPANCLANFHAVTNSDPRLTLIPGGDHRQRSVLAGLEWLDICYQDNIETVQIADANRPAVLPSRISQLERKAIASGMDVCCGMPVVESIGMVHRTCVVDVLERSSLWELNTPACFQFNRLLAVHRLAAIENVLESTDARLLARYTAGTIAVVKCSRQEMWKITFPGDAIIAEIIMENMQREDIQA